MLTYDFEKIEGTLYEYVYRCLKNDILSGGVLPGEKLPSKRTFARNNGVSTITIQNAYDQLISEGYIYTIPKKGYYVAEIGEMRKVPQESNIKLNINMPKESEAKIDLSSNQIHPDKFPFSVWAKLSRETISEKKHELMEVSPTGGKYELRCAIAEHLKSFRGMLVDPNQIVVGAGTEYLYGLLVQLLGQDNNICLENPGYKKVEQIYSQYNIKCSCADIDDYGLSVENLKKSGADIAHISPNHHFPTGITMPANRRYEVLAWANEKEGRYIIEDDYDSEFRSSGRPVPTLFSIDACEKVIYMNTFSKSLTHTMRISYMVLPVHLVNRFYEKLSFYACTVSNFEQHTLTKFIEQGYFEKHINRMRLYYSRQGKKVLEVIKKSKLNDYCQVIENGAGTHFLLKVKTQIDDEMLIKNLREKGIVVKSLMDYYLDNARENQHVLVINYSNLEAEWMEKACEEIYNIIK